MSFLVSAILLLGCSVVSYANDEVDVPAEGEIIEEYLYTLSFCNDLSISNYTANCSSEIERIHQEIDKIVISHTLQEKYGNAWYNVGYQSSTFYDFEATYVSYEYNLSSGRYRLKSTADVYRGNNYETITIYSGEKTC